MTRALATAYFPALPEIMVTVGLVAIEILGVPVRGQDLPVLPREDLSLRPLPDAYAQRISPGGDSL
ncbi:MAG: hypothetical protein R3E46_12270 [Sedimenticolaceae bacterium]